MGHDVKVKWVRAGDLERWFASVERPTFTDSFARVERIEGQWWLILYPKWSTRYRPGLREQRIPYRRGRTAKKHLEAWVRASWPAIELRWGIYRPPNAEDGDEL
jgi:hypothetical protein